MAIVSSQIFCGGIDPTVFFLQCIDNIAFVGGSIAAVVIMGIVFGYYIIKIRTFDNIFSKMMKADFIVTGMYFAVAFTAPSVIALRVMIWLFGPWILGMLLSPFNKDRKVLKAVAEYGSLVALGVLLSLHFIPIFEEYQSSFALGMMLSSILSVFGSGRFER